MTANTWNGENRLIATESSAGVPPAARARETWTHLPDGRWIERVVYSWNGSAYVAQSTNRFVWDRQVLLAIVDHTNGLVTSFARGLDLSGSLQGAGGVGGVLAVNIATNGVHFAAFDGNGNVSALVSATNGAVTANYEYSPFGETLRANGVIAKANPLRFSTQLADEVTGDLKYLFREYQPPVGRWRSKDPIAETGGKNLYAFVANRSIDLIDRLGMRPLFCSTCNGVSYNVLTHCCCKGKVTSKAGVIIARLCAARAAGGPYDHEWLEFPDGGSAGFYPKDGIFGNPGEVHIPEDGPGISSPNKKCSDVKVNPCVYDIPKTKAYMWSLIWRDKFNPPIYCAIGGNCGDWAGAIIGAALQQRRKGCGDYSYE